MKYLSKYSWLGLAGILFPWVAFAQDAAAAVAGPAGALGAAGAALGIAIAVFGAATAQGRIAASYMEGVARNPGAEKVMKTQLILCLVFVETLVIFTLGIVVMVVLKI
jgi:F-type H+-transporting ATPase subunit c